MTNMMDWPLLLFAVSLIALWLAAQTGSWWSRRGKLDADDQADLGVIVAAALTLLGLIIGFTFSMAISRYNQRKDCEAAEANAIGTEYARAGLLPAADAARVRGLLTSYLSQRTSFYTTRDPRRLQQLKSSESKLQNDLWAAVQSCATTDRSPVMALAVSGMNDVLNAQAYTQAAWWNRIPGAAWALMAAIAVCCSYLVGYTARHSERIRRFFVLPAIVSIAFLLIADIDSPHGGLILVRPQNLESVASSLPVP